MNTEKVKLPNSSYKELFKIIMGYATTDKEVAPKDLTSVTGMHETSISGNTGFLANIGILTDGRKKKLTDAGRKLAEALEHDIEEEIKKQWRNIISNNEFLQKMVAAVRIRKQLQVGAFRSHIAFSAGQPKKPYIMAGAGAIIDILKTAYLIIEEDGQLISIEKTEVVDDYEESHIEIEPLDTRVTRKITRTEFPQFTVNIQIQINVTSKEIDELGPKISSLINEIKRLESGKTGSIEDD